jgi:hypothetical protein
MALKYNFSNMSFLVLISLSALTFPNLNLAQEHFALDTYNHCWGEVPSNPGLSPAEMWTAEAWVYLQDEAAEEQLLFYSDSQPDEWLLRIVDGVPEVLLTLGGSLEFTATGNTPLPLGTWSHIVVQLTGVNLELYLNGNLEASTVATIGNMQAPGPIIFSSDDPDLHWLGLIDQVQLVDTVRYDSVFDPFTTYLPDLRVDDQAIPGWELGTGPGDFMEAWDYVTLYAIINGGAELYIQHNFQYGVRQYYYGQIGGMDHTLSLWMTDQGTPSDAQELYTDPLIAPFFSTPIDTIGEEARLDTGLLFDWSLDFWRDRYYVDISISKEFFPEEALQIAATFAEFVDENIMNRHLFSVDNHSVAVWHFDEGSGVTFTDASGNGHDGTLTNPSWVETTPYQKFPYITSAVLRDGAVLLPEIDEDDTALVTFSEPLLPLNLHAGNIDDVLRLSSGHSWLSGSGELGSVTWNLEWDTLKVSFSLNGGLPSISDGDTLTPNPTRIISSDSLAAGGYRFVRFDFPSGVSWDDGLPIPSLPHLYTPYPCPFNAQTAIRIELPHEIEINLSVYNLYGQKVDNLFNGKLTAGQHSFTWNAGKYVSGIYFISMEAGKGQFVRKVVLLK